MQALQFAVDYPDLVRGVVAIASTAHLDTQGVALNSVARNAITSDPDWQGGDYYGTGRAPRAGLALARQIGHITYLSKDSLREKFPGDRFAVESYLAYQGEKFVERFDANTYLLMSRALTRFDLPPARLRDARARFLLLSFTSDWIYPPERQRRRSPQRSRRREGRGARELETTYGHDSFLLEDETAGAVHPAVSRAHLRGDTMNDEREWGFDTRQVHAGQRPDPYTGARADPDLPDGELRLRGRRVGGRVLQPPGVRQHLLADHEPDHRGVRGARGTLEGGVGAVAFASGLAAQAAALFTLLEPGDHIVAQAALYGGTITQLKHLQRKFGFEVTFVDGDSVDAWRAALRPETKALFGETIGNPGGNVLDIEAVAAVAREHGAPLIVDSTFATPYLCRPAEHGADIVIHSATKFIGGHGTSIGGIVVDAGSFEFANGRFPVLTDPSPAYHGLAFIETYGVYGYLMKLRAESLRDLGACLSPFNAFLFLQGLETLSLRMDRHVSNAQAVAAWLEQHPAVARVRYAGLPSSPYHELAQRYLPLGAGSIFAFDLAGGRDAGSRVRRGLARVEPPRERRRREVPRHPPGVDDSPPALGRGARGRRHRARDDSPLGGDRVRGRPHLGSRAGAVTYQDPHTIQSIINNAKTVAIVGLSPNELRASHFVGYYLRRHGYTVIPVNPREESILGQRSYASLSDVPVHIDVVDVFRAAGRRARDRGGGGRRRRRGAVAAVRRHQPRGSRDRRRGAVSTSSWTGA